MELTSKQKENLPQITLITASVFLKWLTEAVDEIYRELGKIFQFQIFFLNDLDTGKVAEDKLISSIYNSDIMLLDIRGNSPTVEILVDTYRTIEKENPDLFETKQIIALVGGNSEIRRLTKMGSFQARKIPSPSIEGYSIDEIPDLTNAVRFGQKMTNFLGFLGKVFPIKTLRHARYWVMMMDYWVYGLGGISVNHKNMILFLLKHYLGKKNLHVDKPKKIPPYGIYDPILNEYFQTSEEYFQKTDYNSSRQTIGIFYYGGLYFEQSLPIVKEFMRKLQEFNILPVFSDVMTNIQAYETLFFKKERCIVSAVINLQYFQLNGGPFGGDSETTLELFKKMDIPQFSPIIQYDSTFEEYMKSKEGIIPINQVIAIVMPELDGRLEMTTVGLLEELGFSEKINSNILEVKPLEDNINLYCERIKKWLQLRIKKNQDKKIAIVIYNYPPGEDKIGNAAYLDVSDSIKQLMTKLHKEGYDTGDFTTEYNLMELFINQGVVNLPKYTDIKDFKGVNFNFQEYTKYFHSLSIEQQQDVIQYWGEPPGNIMLDNSHIRLPIISFGNIYLCVQPSRSRVSGDSNEYHDKNLPPHHQYLAFYHYLENNLRIDALIHMGTHGTEEFLPGKECAGWIHDFNLKLIGSLPNIYYYHISNTSESAIAKRRANAVIINHAGPTFQESGLYDEFERLEELISEYQNKSFNMNIDVTPDQSEFRIKDLIGEIKELTKNMNLEYTSISELDDKLYQFKQEIIPMGLHTLGIKYTDQQKHSLLKNIFLHSTEKPQYIEDLLSYFNNDNEIVDKEKLDEFLNDFYELLSLENNLNDIKNKLTSHYDIEDDTIRLAIDWMQNLMVRIDKTLELDNIIHSLEGGYIEPGLGGDPIRSPHIFPTGKNSYGFDPRLIPNSTALNRGNEIAETLLQDYYNEHHKWPKSVSVVLWAFETMKTGGETIGQIFNYIGVRPVKNKSVWTTELEVIPLTEMSHPRINVLITICGIFRDTFPYHLELINKAIELVAELDEDLDQNYIKKSVVKMKQQGLKNTQARIFGPPPGKYNTNLTEIISAGKWDNEKELAEDYVRNMSFAYMKNQKVKQLSENFSQTINNIKIMSQIRDSSEYSITDLDHYYEFTGGLARTFKQLSGKEANVYIADSSKKDIKVQTLQNSIKEGAITRSLNPKWIKSLLKHKYHGGQKVADRVENFLGLSATTHQVDNWIWDKAYDQYIENQEIRELLGENNRFAMMDIIKNMLQANNRGYWDANEDQIDNLKKVYLELENWVELKY